MSGRFLSRFLVLVLTSALLHSGCKKEEEKSTFDKVAGKWIGVEVYYEEFPPGQPAHQESEDISAYNFNCRTDGILVIDSAGFDAEFYQWSVTNDDQFVWRFDANEVDVLDITVLTDTQLHLEETGEYDSGNGVMVPYRDVIKLRR